MKSFTITRPDDWHLHLRDGAALKTVVPHTAKRFARAMIMPNLRPPITTVSAALAYHQRILQAVPEGMTFEPLMTLYLTETMSIEEITRAASTPEIMGCKLYPAGATTHSDAGVARIERIFPVLEAMQKLDLPLLIHGEVTESDTDIFDREKAFIDSVLSDLVSRFPELRIVLEHVTTEEGVSFVRESSRYLAATITAHHLLFNRNMLLAGGMRPHYYCLPVLKRESHRQALLSAATSGEQKFFLGTDSAPHSRSAKESFCGCAGCYTAYAAVELYATAFEAAGKLEALEKFASFNGPDFYRLSRNTEQITLEKSEWQAPEEFQYDGDSLIPLQAGERIPWRLQ